MRRNYISPEYKYSEVPGTFNFMNESNFMCNILFNLPKDIGIINDDILYYANNNGEQIIGGDQSITTFMINTSDLKFNNHEITNINNNWNIRIYHKSILLDYMFYMFKKYNTFQNIENSMTISNDVNFYIKRYIIENFLDIYDISNIDLFIENINLSLDNTFKGVPIYDRNIINDNFKFTKIVLTRTNEYIDLSFKITTDPNKFIFKYYFNLKFTR